jgi:hypothetical protein
MKTQIDIYQLPHIVALRGKLERARTVLALPERYTRREPLCPNAAADYNAACREYFAAVDEAREGLRNILASIAAAYGHGPEPATMCEPRTIVMFSMPLPGPWRRTKPPTPLS